MLSLDDHIEYYTDPHFDASQSAQQIFASYGETEIAKKLNDMSKIQSSIETILKTNVKENYPTFLQATEQVNQVGQEMSELKILIENTKKLINDVHGTKISESRAMRTNSLLPTLQNKRAVEALHAEVDRIEDMYNTSSSDSAIPSWLAKAPDDLARFIVEQQYAKAVSIVMKTRTYVEGLLKSQDPSNDSQRRRTVASLNNAVTEKATEVLKQVENRSMHLADIIKNSLHNLPSSPVWGNIEQYKRLKLLVTLKEYSLAAEGFSFTREQTMHQAINNIDFSPDLLIYTKDLCQSFYNELTVALTTFTQLFEEINDNAEILTLFLKWILTQMKKFSMNYINQVNLAVNEAGIVTLMQLREQMNQFRNSYAVLTTKDLPLAPANSPVPASNTPNNNSAYVSPLSPSRSFRSASIRASIISSSNNLGSFFSNQTTNPLPQPAAIEIKGGLVLLHHSLQYAFQIAYENQNTGELLSSQSIKSTVNSNKNNTNNTILSSSSSTKNLLKTHYEIPLASFFAYSIMPDIRFILISYFDFILKDITFQVKQDLWTHYPLGHVFTLTEFSTFKRWLITINQEENVEVSIQSHLSLSYIWMVFTLYHMIDEIKILFRCQENNSINLREELNDMEPVVVSCFLRLVLRYVIELETIHYETLTKSQQECYRATLQMVLQQYIPALRRGLEELFYADRLALLPKPPQSLLKNISFRINQILSELN